MPDRRTLLKGSLVAAVVAAIPAHEGVAAPAGRSIDVVRDRRARAEVVIADEASDQLVSAAHTLIEYVEKSTGAVLAMKRSGAWQRSRMLPIFVGLLAPDSSDGVGDRVADLPVDGFIIAADHRAVTIIGESDHGTRFGVLDVIERHLDVRWLMPGDVGEDVPDQATLSIPIGLRSDHPGLINRTLSPLQVESASNSPDWASSDPQVIWASRARTHRYVMATHNLWRIFPVEQYGLTHPEYYPVINGEPRIPAPGVQTAWQPHFSEPGTVDVAVDHILDHFEQFPDHPSFSLAVNDSDGFSEDDLVDGPSGSSASEAYYHWVNSVISRVVERNPSLSDKVFGLLAYRRVGTPPSFALHPQAVPFLTNDRYGWADPDFAHRDQQVTDAWADRATRVGLYEYVYGTPYLIPRIYTSTMGEVYQRAATHGVAAQAGELYPNWGEGPKPWVYAKLLWDPAADARALAAEWCRRAVGDAAAVPLAAYFDLWEEIWNERIPETDWFGAAVDARNPYFYFNYSDYLTAVTPHDVATARDLLEAARDATTTAPQQARAELLLRAFEYYEASALSRPADVNPPTDEDQALALTDAMSADLDDVVTLAQKRPAINAGLNADPILKHHLQPSRYGMYWTGHSGSTLWSLADWVREHEPSGGPVTSRLQSLAEEGDRPAARGAALALHLATETEVSLTRNPSFEDGGTVPDHWTPGGSVQFARVEEGARTGNAALGLGPTPGADLRQRFAVTPGLLAARVWYRTPTAAPGFLTLLLALYDPEGGRIASMFQTLRTFSPTAGEWAWVGVAEDIPPVFQNRIVGQVELVLGVAAFDGAESQLWIDDFEAHLLPREVGEIELTNPGFEQVVANLPLGWTANTDTVSSSTEVVRTGERSVLLEDPSPTRAVSLASGRIPATPGSTYVAGVWVYNATGENSSVLYLRFWDAAGAVAGQKIASTRDRDSWLPLEATMVAPDNAVTVGLLLYRDSAGVGSAYFDDASLIRQE